MWTIGIGTLIVRLWLIEIMELNFIFFFFGNVFIHSLFINTALHQPRSHWFIAMAGVLMGLQLDYLMRKSRDYQVTLSLENPFNNELMNKT